jgi:hypothetical protein
MHSNKNTINIFKDVKIDIKIKISALWVTLMFFFIYGDILSFYEPGNIGEIMAGKMGPFSVTQVGLLISSILMMIPSVMVFLCLTVKAKFNRWVNIILGTFYAAVALANLFGEIWAYYITFGIVEILISFLIVWCAWKWPKQEV